MNKKGFTVVEVVIAFSMLGVVLISLFGFVTFYRDKTRSEEIRTQLLDFKNTITKVIYDDIVGDKIVKIEYCDGIAKCVNFKDPSNETHVLMVVEDPIIEGIKKKGLYLNYDETMYMLPDSDLRDTNGYMCFFDEFTLQNYNDEIYSLKITFMHHSLNESFTINLTIN